MASPQFALIGAIAQMTVVGDPAPPPVRYSLTIDSAAASSVRVEMRIPAAPDTLRLAMAAHPEYDDRFWRYVRDVRVERGGTAVPVAREDSSIWRAVGRGDAVVRYRVEPPTAEEGRGSWVGYLSPTGGLLGGPHSFMYVLGGERAAARVTVRLPNGWSLATGMAPARGGAFVARNARDLIDSPIMVGPIRRWRFTIAGVDHDVAYLPAPGGVQFDTIAMVAGLARFARAAHGVFGVFPYRRYTFLVQEGAGGGGLEHGTSVTLGLSTRDMAAGGSDFYADASHEFFHAWNEMALRPRGWGGLGYRPSPPTRELWWMEGVTMYYADVLSRRAGLPLEDATRAEDLAVDIGRYLDNPANRLVSPEDASWWSGNSTPAPGGLTPDLYLQGKLLGAALDLRIRAATRGRRSLDDAIRRLFTTHREPRGYTGADIEQAVTATCSCPMRAFFDSTVRRAGMIDFDAALAAAGLRADVTLVAAADGAGVPRPDIRVWATVPGDATRLRLSVTQPDGVWAAAGLRTGDVVLAWNGDSVTTIRELRTKLRSLHTGDSVVLDYARGDSVARATVQVSGYSEHRVRLVSLPGASREALAIRRAALLDIDRAPR